MRRLAMLLCLLATTAISRPAAASVAPEYTVIPLVRRIDAYFRSNRTDGVTLDSRFAINPSEAIRQGVVCQLLGYRELYRVHPTRRLAREIAVHADYLSAHLNEVNSGTPFDGMLDYSLVLAFEVSHDSTHYAAAQTIASELEAIPTSECILNGGLMVAMAMVEWAKVTGDPVAAQKAADIVASVVPYQHTDGSFPHWCICSKDIHYTGWMSQELILLQRELHDPAIATILAGTLQFLDDRVDANGLPHYEDPCPGQPGCWTYYDSQRTGCSYDYDTRGITVEPGYEALVFANAGSARFEDSMRYLLSLENCGTFKDKWAYIEPPGDPQYPWSSADTSVANMSILFWSMSTILSGRGPSALADSLWFAGDGSEDPIDATVPIVAHPPRLAAPLAMRGRLAPAQARLIAAGPAGAAYCDAPAPARAVAAAPASRAAYMRNGALHFALAHAGECRLDVFDVAGRRQLSRDLGMRAAGAQQLPWPEALRAGLYLVRIRSGSHEQHARIVVAR